MNSPNTDGALTALATVLYCFSNLPGLLSEVSQRTNPVQGLKAGPR